MAFYQYMGLPDGSIAVRHTRSAPWKVHRGRAGNAATCHHESAAKAFTATQNRTLKKVLAIINKSAPPKLRLVA